jgi:phosphate starvation-inducible protein PhoH and related proteins
MYVYMQIRSLFPLVVLVSRFVSIRGFVPLVNTRGIYSSGFQMRLKKTISDDDYINSGHNGLSLPIGSGNGNRRSRSKNMIPTYRPRSENQKQYVSHLQNDDVPVVFGIGPAGCGKTLFACVTAIEGLKRGDFQKIILTRPIVPVEEEELGFLPGTLVKKMDPWTRPLMDIFLEFFSQQELDFMINSGVIEISPLAYMRGRTFKRCFIIADEMQNSTPNQMLMLTTRIGNDSKMVITGDLKQSDRSSDKNGLLDVMNKIHDYKGRNVGDGVGIEIVVMNHSDIERSPIVSKILDIYNPVGRNITQTIDSVKTESLVATVSVIDVVPTVPVNNTLSISDVPKPRAIDINNDAALIPKSHISKMDFL